jgi:Peptidase propeptide and YPEB domain
MRRTGAIAVGAGLAITVFGGGLALAYDGGTPSASAEAPAAVHSVLPSDTATPSATGTRISRAVAEQIALGAVPGGRVRSVELEPEHGRLVWKVKVIAANCRDWSAVSRSPC